MYVANVTAIFRGENNQLPVYSIELVKPSGCHKHIDAEEVVVLGDDDERVSGPDEASSG